MLLKNKKTGEIGNLDYRGLEDDNDEGGEE